MWSPSFLAAEAVGGAAAGAAEWAQETAREERGRRGQGGGSPAPFFLGQKGGGSRPSAGLTRPSGLLGKEPFILWRRRREPPFLQPSHRCGRPHLPGQPSRASPCREREEVARLWEGAPLPGARRWQVKPWGGAPFSTHPERWGDYRVGAGGGSALGRSCGPRPLARPPGSPFFHPVPGGGGGGGAAEQPSP